MGARLAREAAAAAPPQQQQQQPQGSQQQRPRTASQQALRQQGRGGHLVRTQVAAQRSASAEDTSAPPPPRTPPSQQQYQQQQQQQQQHVFPMSARRAAVPLRGAAVASDDADSSDSNGSGAIAAAAASTPGALAGTASPTSTPTRRRGRKACCRMLAVLMRLLEVAQNLGVSHVQNALARKRVRAMNSMAMFLGFLTTLYTFIFSWFEFYGLTIFLFFTTMLYMAVPVLNHFNLMSQARTVVLLNTNSVVLIHCVNVGSAIPHCFVVPAVAPFLLFDTTESVREMYSFVALSIGLRLAMIFTIEPDVYVPEPVHHVLFISLQLAALACVILILSLLFFEQTRSLEQLRSNEQHLQDTVEKLKHANKQAKVATVAKSRFVANMSHELRTPLNSIMGVAELMKGSATTPDQEEALDLIHSSGNALLALISDILDFSRIESNQLELEWWLFDVHACVEEALRVCSPAAVDKRLELVVRIEDAVPTSLFADESRMRQVIINLCGNAIKFTSRGFIAVTVSRVSVRSLEVPERTRRHLGRHIVDTWDPADGLVFFRVEDCGIGIPSSKFESVFEPFSQGDASTTRKYGGTGLGLSICRRLVRLMGGDMWAGNRVSPSGDVLGACVSFVLPVTGKMRRVPTTRQASLSMGVPLRELSAVIATSCDVLFDSLRHTLSLWGMQHVARAHSTGEAFGARAALVFLDGFLVEDERLPVESIKEAARYARLVLLEHVKRFDLHSADARLSFAAIVSKPVRFSQLATTMSHLAAPPVAAGAASRTSFTSLGEFGGALAGGNAPVGRITYQLAAPGQPAAAAASSAHSASLSAVRSRRQSASRDESYAAALAASSTTLSATASASLAPSTSASGMTSAFSSTYLTQHAPLFGASASSIGGSGSQTSHGPVQPTALALGLRSAAYSTASVAAVTGAAHAAAIPALAPREPPHGHLTLGALAGAQPVDTAPSTTGASAVGSAHASMPVPPPPPPTSAPPSHAPVMSPSRSAAVAVVAAAAAASRHTVAVAAAAAAAPPADIPPLRILLAEDVEANQRVMRLVLSKLGQDAVIVGDGVEAVEHWREHRDVELILMDMQMPRMDGVEATRQLRFEGCEAFIVALTANVFTSDRDACMRAGCDGFVAKPISRAKLEQTFRDCVRYWQARRAHQPAAARGTTDTDGSP